MSIDQAVFCLLSLSPVIYFLISWFMYRKGEPGKFPAALIFSWGIVSVVILMFFLNNVLGGQPALAAMVKVVYYQLNDFLTGFWLASMVFCIFYEYWFKNLSFWSLFVILILFTLVGAATVILVAAFVSAIPLVF